MTNPLDHTQNYFVKNSSVLPVSQFDIAYFECSKIIYEVIKVIRNKPLFFQEHMDRLHRSCNLAGFNSPTSDYISNGVIQLLDANPVELKNLRISLCFSCSENSLFLCYFVDSHYPTFNDYQNGVRVEILQEVRNLPNVKADNPRLRNAADTIIKSQNVYETLLVNEDGYVTECSRSNFFAVDGNRLVTPPAREVLEGVTRLKVMELAKLNGIECIERKIKLDELPSFDGVFITGTSRGVLPLNAIGNLHFSPQNIVIQRLIRLYNQEVEQNVKGWNAMGK